MILKQYICNIIIIFKKAYIDIFHPEIHKMGGFLDSLGKYLKGEVC